MVRMNDLHFAGDSPILLFFLRKIKQIASISTILFHRIDILAITDVGCRNGIPTIRTPHDFKITVMDNGWQRSFHICNCVELVNNNGDFLARECVDNDCLCLALVFTLAIALAAQSRIVLALVIDLNASVLVLVFAFSATFCATLSATLCATLSATLCATLCATLLPTSLS